MSEVPTAQRPLANAAMRVIRFAGFWAVAMLLFYYGFMECLRWFAGGALG